MALKSFRELIVWQKAMDLVELIYKATHGFPKEELFCLTQQLRRAAISIPSNVAEGQGRDSTKEFLHHLSFAYGSLCELETQTALAQRLGYINNTQNNAITEQAAEVGRLINGLTKKLKQQTSGQ
jgi:four helix bundle protein